MKTINLYRNAANVTRVVCSPKGYVEYIQKESEMFGRSGCYALFTHNGTLIGTCGYEAGVDRFREFSEMSNFLLNDYSKFDEKTGAIIERLDFLDEVLADAKKKSELVNDEKDRETHDCVMRK